MERRIVSFNFVSGLDQKTDPKLTTKLTTADNVVIRKNGTIEKRLGFVTNGSYTIGKNPVQVFPFNESEIAISDNTGDENGQSFLSKINNAWFLKSASLAQHAIKANVDIRPLAYSAGDIGNHAIACAGQTTSTSGYALCAYSVTSATTYGIQGTRFLDLQTNAAIDNQDSLGLGTALGPFRADAANTSSTLIITTCFSGSALQFGPHFGTGEVSLTSVVGCATANYQADTAVIGTKLFFATKATGSTNLIIGSYDTSTFALTSISVAGTVTADILTAVVPQANTDRFRLIWASNTARTAYQASYSLTLSTILSPTAFTVGFPGYGPLTQLGGVENVGNTVVSIVCTQSSTTTGFPAMSGFAGNWSNTSTSVSGSQQANGLSLGYGLPGCTMATKPFIHNSGIYCVFNNTSTGQQSYVLARRVGINTPYLVAVARTHYGTATGNQSTSYAWLPNVQSIGNDVFATALRRTANVFAVNSAITFSSGVDLVLYNFNQTASRRYVQTNDTTYLTGGFLSEFDGVAVGECGFLGSPVIMTVSVTTTGGNIGATTGSGTYSMVICKELIDGTGKTHRGQPSTPITFATSTSTGSVTITFCDLPGAREISPQFINQTRYAVFRTTNGGSIYYRDSIKTGLGAGITAITHRITSSDTTLAGGDVLYTQGGVLPNWTPDATNALCLHRDRLFCADTSDDSIVRYSKKIQLGEAVAFSVFNVIQSQGNGPVTSLASLDSSLVVFRKRSISIVSGDGPDDTGSNGDFGSGQIIYEDVGSIDQANTCRFSQGIIFKSPDKGFYLLGRDLQVSYIGADVESYNSKTVVSSQVVGIAEQGGTAEECRFLCSDGTLLTYNYFAQAWTTATLAGCTDAVQTGGRYVVVNPSSTAANARVFQQSTSTYTDAFSNTSATYQMTVETGWIKTADIQGFQRIWLASVLGESQGAGSIVTEVGYDYESTYNEAHTATMSSITAANFPGGPTAIAQFNFKPIRQKCQAIRFKFTDLPSSTGAVMKLTNLSLECGTKSGLFKMPETKGA